MIRTGLCSVTLRALAIGDVAAVTAAAGLESIEWGGDVHVPPGDMEAAESARAATAAAGLRVASYGSYYRCHGDFDAVVASARALGAPRIRIWAGDVASAGASAAHWESVARAARDAAEQAAAHGIEVAFEFHGGTLTDTAESVLALLGAGAAPREDGAAGRPVASRGPVVPRGDGAAARAGAIRGPVAPRGDGAAARPAPIRSYWQPPQDLPDEDALAGLRSLLAHVPAVHVFSWWPGATRRRLAERASLWRAAFELFTTGDALLEFVPDDDPALVADEARTLSACSRRPAASRPETVLAMRADLPPRLFSAAAMERLQRVASIDPRVVLGDFRGANLERVEVILSGWGCPRIDEPVLDRAPHLRAIVHAAGSIRGHVDAACWERGIRVSSAAAANAEPVAEYTLARILLANKAADRMGRAYRERRGPLDLHREFPDVGNFGKTVGIVGASRIGRRVIELLQPFALRVLVSDPYLDDSVELDELLRALRRREPARTVAAEHPPPARRSPARAPARRRDADQHRPRRAGRPGRAHRRARQRPHRRRDRRDRARGPPARLAALRPAQRRPHPAHRGRARRRAPAPRRRGGGRDRALRGRPSPSHTRSRPPISSVWLDAIERGRSDHERPFELARW